MKRLLLERFRERLAETGLIPEGAKVLVGYSGGPDSTCMLSLLADCGVHVVGGHLHHGQRPEADEEQRRCGETCAALGVPFLAGRADVPAIARAKKVGIEEAGRRARYEFFERARVETGCDLIATAHTLDDHAETVLLNVARGSGIGGLAGIPERRDRIVRPLLAFTRAEARAYCDEHGFWYHDDPCNDDLAFSRVRLRKNVMPELERINAGAAEALARLADVAGEEDRFLDGMAAAALEQVEEPLNGALRFLTIDSEVAFRRGGLMALPPVLVSRGLRLAFGVLGAQLDFAQTRALRAALAAERKGSLTAEGGVVVLEWDEKRVHLRQLPGPPPFGGALKTPGETDSPALGWRLAARSANPADYRREPRGLEAVIDADRVKGALSYRSLEAGDAMAPLGMTGRRKLSEMMAEAGYTPGVRRVLPLVCDELGPVWAPGTALAERVKVTEATTRVLSLVFGPIG